jgi:hypothetical protein
VDVVEVDDDPDGCGEPDTSTQVTPLSADCSKVNVAENVPVKVTVVEAGIRPIDDGKWSRTRPLVDPPVPQAAEDSVTLPTE